MKYFLFIVTVISPIHAMEPGKQQSWNGAYYHQNSSPQLRAAIKLLQSLDMTEHKAIVDIGCGSGEVTYAITHLAPLAYVIGTDASASMIEKAENTYGQKPRLSFKLVDAQDESHSFFKEAQFDLAFSSAALLWMPNKQAVFNNIHCILKDGGKMVVKTTQPLAPNHPLSWTMKQLAQNPKWISFVAEYQSRPQHFPLSKQDAQTLFSPDRWTDITIEESEIVNEFNTEADLGKWMKGWMGALPAFRSLPAEQQAELNTEFVHIYAQVPGTRGNGKILYWLPGLIIKATKK